MEVDRTGRPIAIRKVPSTEKEIRKFICHRNPFNHMTVAFRRSIVSDLGGYPDIFLKEDYALWACMLSRGVKMTNLEYILVNATAGSEMYRRRGGGKYVRSEIDIQKYLIKMGLQSNIGGFFIGVTRSLIFIMPASLRGFVYEMFLRKSI